MREKLAMLERVIGWILVHVAFVTTLLGIVLLIIGDTSSYMATIIVAIVTIVMRDRLFFMRKRKK